MYYSIFGLNDFTEVSKKSNGVWSWWQGWWVFCDTWGAGLGMGTKWAECWYEWGYYSSVVALWSKAFANR